MTGNVPRVVSSLAELSGRIVLAIGAFDGVHRGHQAVFAQLMMQARKFDAVPVALFFQPLPRQVLHPERPLGCLTSLEEKVARMGECGVEVVVEMPFDLALAALPAKDFIYEYLLSHEALQVLSICVGEDFRFGAENRGDVALLKEVLAPAGVEVAAVAGLQEAGEWISSSRIRRAVAQGELELASRLLGRPYALQGRVAHGNGIATKKLECPTANLVDEAVQLPPYGVYAARTQLQDGRAFNGIVYIGDAPTIRGIGNGHPIVELHLFDFKGNLYDERIAVEPVKFLRESRVFADADALTRQIQTDIVNARNALENK